jgi:hypothetical protein
MTIAKMIKVSKPVDGPEILEDMHRAKEWWKTNATVVFK